MPATFFRKKPVTVAAMKFDGSPESMVSISQWMGEHGQPGMGGIETNSEERVLRIETLEGTMTASAGDWIIRGIKGEFYPCKADIFEATYESVA